MQDNRTAYNLLLRNFFQYESLRKETIKFFYRQSICEGKPIDCYIDLNCFLRSLYHRTNYTIDDPMCIASAIINFCAHIRAFYASRFSIPTYIHLVYGSNSPKSATDSLGVYNAHNTMEKINRPDVNTIIERNLELLEILVPYIPEVYFIRDDFATEPAVIIRELIKYRSSVGIKPARFIFTKDTYDYQLVATCPNTHIIRVYKTMQGDLTYTISYFDFYKKISKSRLKTPIGEGLSPELYSLYMSLSGCKDRNITNIYPLPVADSRIKKAIESGMILNGYNQMLSVNPESFMSIVQEDMCSIVYDRYRALDIIYQGHIYINNPSYMNLAKCFVDLYDPNAVRSINDQYFKRYPLDLNVL